MTRTAASLARKRIKQLARGGGLATSLLRPLPDFLIIGAKRGGTTSLYFDLLEHPAVMYLYPPPVPMLKTDATKGVHYFDSHAYRSEAWYRSYFPTYVARSVTRRRARENPIAGEASPYYLFHPAAVDRAHALTPGSKIIAQLRDPVLRAYSHWKERRRNNAETLDFTSALDAEPDRLAGERQRLLSDPRYVSYAWEQQSYAAQSEYAGHLARWIDAYGRDQVHVTLSEEYYADPRGVMADIHEFLGVTALPPATSFHRNAARGEDLDEGVRRKLATRFSDSNHRLATLLGRELPWG